MAAIADAEIADKDKVVGLLEEVVSSLKAVLETSKQMVVEAKEQKRQMEVIKKNCPSNHFSLENFIPQTLFHAKFFPANSFSLKNSSRQGVGKISSSYN